MSDSKAQLQEALKSRDAAAAETNYVNFSDWYASGAGNNIYASVTISPANSGQVISYALLILQTPQGLLLAQGSLNTSTGQANWNLNLSTGSDAYDVGQYGTTVEAQAYAQIYGVGGNWSAVQSFTVQ